MSRRDLVVLLAGAMLFASAAINVAQDAPDEAAQQAIADRFTQVLERNPRRGTAFDKVYGYHVERGTLEDFLKGHRDKAEQNGSATHWMIVGLVEAQRGRDPEAIQAFTKAEKLDPNNAMASYLLGQSLILEGQTDQAAQAVERAIARQPAPADLLDMYQTLGRVYQRAQKNDKALDVWNRLEKHFPNDARVQEQIAMALLEEGDLAAALPRFENLAKSTKDKNRQAMFQVEAAEIKVRLGKTQEGLKDFESLMKQLNPGAWLFRDVRRRVETVFLKENNQAGLIEYYEAWIDKNPEDLDAISQLSHLLAGIRRSAEARSWLLRALKQAPSNKELRLALINLFAGDLKYAEAAAQYQELEKYDPNNPDLLRDWGRVILKDFARDRDERRQAASTVWRKLLAARPNDAHAAAQVAELFRNADMSEEAIELYRKAIALAPDDIQYREYLGEYFQKLKQPEQALSTWREIATGSRRSATNIARLAELLARNELLTEAIDANAEACQLDPKDLNLQLKHADLLSKAGRHEEALKQLSVAQKLVANDEERDAWLQRELAELKVLDQLTARIAEVQHEVTGSGLDKAQQVQRLYWLALANDAAGKSRSALDAIDRANELSPGSIPILVATARLNETQRNLRRAAETYMKLAAIDRRFRTDYLQRVAKLEEQLGRREQALQAGRELVAAAPANPEISNFFAQMCFRLGKSEEGIQAMRRALRANPGDIGTLIRLAAVLVQHKQAPEGIELLWRAFERANNLDEQLPIIQQLAEAYGKTAQINALYVRLERERRDPARHREMTLCLAQAHESAGDLVNAQRKLESLLSDDSRDTDLLGHLRNLAERQKDLQAAIRYQRKLWQITASRGDRFRLAQLMLHAGQGDEAIDLLTAEDGGNKELTPDVLKLLDALLKAGRQNEVAARIRRLRQQFPDNWELLYREGVVLSSTPAEALTRFEALLRLNVDHDDPSMLGSAASMQMTMSTATPLPLVSRMAQLPAIQQAMELRQQVQRAPGAAQTGFQPAVRTAVVSQFVWSPADFGAARLAGWYWVLRLTQGGANSTEKYLAEHFPELDRPANRQQRLDQIAVLKLQNRTQEHSRAVRELMGESNEDLEAKVLYLQSLAPITIRLQTSPNGSVQQVREQTTTLRGEQLEEALSVYQVVAKRSDLSPLNVTLMEGLVRELTAAGRAADVTQLIQDAAKNATTRGEVQYLLIRDYSDPQLKITCQLLDRLIDFHDQPGHGGAMSGVASTMVTADRLPQVLQIHVSENSYKRGDLMSLWSRYVRLAAMEARRNPPAVLFNPPQRTATYRLVSGVNASGTRTMVAQPGVQGETSVPGFVYGADAQSLLTHIRRMMVPDDRANLISDFELEARAEERAPLERLYWRHAVAFVSWMEGNKDSALSILADGVNEFPERQDLRLGLVRLYEMNNKQDKALELADTINAGNSVDQRELDKISLRLALTSNKTDRAKEAVLRLSAGDVPQGEFDGLIGQLVQLHLFDRAEDMLVRAGDLRPLDYDQFRTLMEVQLELGKNDEAAKSAAALLARLESQTPVVQQVRTVNGQQVTVANKPIQKDVYQRACYKVLSSAGKLDAYIESAEKELEASPKSDLIISKLISLHTANANQIRVDELIVYKLKMEADKPPNRYALALKYIETSHLDDALEQMKILLDRDPDYFASRCRETLFRYDTKKELLPEFGRLLTKLDWCASPKGMAVLPSVIDQLRARDATSDMADELFLKMWDTRPESRVVLLQRFGDNHWWTLKRVQDDFKAVVMSPGGTDAQDQWKIFGQAMRYDDGDAGLVTVWNRMLLDAMSRNVLDALAMDIQQGIQQRPDWKAGPVLLAMIDLRQGRMEAGHKALETQLPMLEPTLKTNQFMAWEIGQELARHRDSLDLGSKFLMIAIQQSGGGQVKPSGKMEWMSASSPGSALIRAYAAHGRHSDARKLLVESMPPQVQTNTDPAAVPSAADLTQVLTIGRALRSINYQMDAIEMYLDALQRAEKMSIGGYDPRNELQASLVVAFGELKPEHVVEFLEQFDVKNRSLNPRLFVRQSDPGRGRIQTRWEMMLSGIANNEELNRRTRTAIEKIAAAQSDSVMPLILLAQLSLASDGKDLTKAIDRLTQFAQQHPLTKAKAATSADGDQIALWLIARDCLTRPELKTAASELGDRALQAAVRTSRSNFESAIQNEIRQIEEQSKKGN